jgi:hypothetical protein
MGNTYCSSCECVKGDKQNEFDDSKEQPMPQKYEIKDSSTSVNVTMVDIPSQMNVSL